MKMHTPLFMLGLLVFVTPIIGFTQFLEQIILGAYGVAIMIIVSTPNIWGENRINFFKKQPEIKRTEIQSPITNSENNEEKENTI